MATRFKNILYQLDLGLKTTVEIIESLSRKTVGQHDNPKYRLDGKVALITGSNTGIGKVAAKDFARRGATVYMGCRNIKKAEAAREEIIAETKNDKVYLGSIDFTDLEKVKAFADWFRAQNSPLHILLNNAGIMFVEPKELSKQGLELHMAVNHHGTFVLTNNLLDILKKSAPARIVTVSSVAHQEARLDFSDFNEDRTPYVNFTSYANSKLGNVLMSNELGRRLQGTGVTTYSLHPGVIDSDLWVGFGGDIKKGGIKDKLVKGFTRLCFKTVEQGAQTSIYCAVEPSIANVTGKYYSNCKEKAATKTAQDPAIQKKMWDVSLKYTAKYIPSGGA